MLMENVGNFHKYRIEEQPAGPAQTEHWQYLQTMNPLMSLLIKKS
jgi:hypothetical protein